MWKFWFLVVLFLGAEVALAAPGWRMLAAVVLNAVVLGFIISAADDAQEKS